MLCIMGSSHNIEASYLLIESKGEGYERSFFNDDEEIIIQVLLMHTSTV